MRSRLPAAGAAVALAGAMVVPMPAAAAVAVVVIDGQGYGHGVGMAQDGALAMGRQGASATQILGQFYPGTRAGRAGGEVRVVVAGPAAGPVTLAFPGGGEVRDARSAAQSPGFPVAVPAGGQVRVRFDGGRYLVEGVGTARPASVGEPVPASVSRPLAAPVDTAPTTTTTRPPLLTLPTLFPPGQSLLPPLLPAPPPTTPPPAPSPEAVGAGATGVSSARPLWAVPAGGGTVEVAGRAQRYRGVLEATAGGSPLRLVNHLDVEQYLRGMGEVRDPSWPQASLRAQAIAARTYALRAVGGGGELCATERCQVYLGAQAEYSAMDRAVTATRGQVVLFGRALASTVYSANGGGTSATTEEGFGTPGEGYPYLRAAPYPTGDPLAWTVRVSLRDVARRLGYRGTIEGIRATAVGPSGRVVQVTLEGSGGARTLSGLDFDQALGLRSTFFTVRTEVADTAPPPPPPATGTAQLLPGQVGGQSAEPTDIGGPAAAAQADPPTPIALRQGAAAAAAATELAAATGVRDDADDDADGRLALAVLAWLALLGVSVAVRVTRSSRFAGAERSAEGV